MTSTVQLQCPHCCCVFDGDATLAFEEHKLTHKNNKNPKGYVAILGLLHDAAFRCGYALGIHGTLGRDLDLLAMPWVEEASTPEKLVEALALACGGRVYSMVDLGGGKIVDNPILKPHGREGWTIVLGGGTYLDVSTMPLRPKQNEAAAP
jgi:hypothetical protein